MRFVQPLLTDEQSLLTSLAIKLILEDEERFVLSEDERAQYEKLATFFGIVAQRPTQFAPTGQNASTVKSIVKRAKGPAQPQTRRNARKARQLRRRAHQKLMRKQRREVAEQWNAAVEQYEQERAEAEAQAQELVERLDAEPKLMLTDAFGNVVMTDIPESLVKPMPVEPDAQPANESELLILPPGVEV